MKKTKILVPTDFTPVAEIAAEHAVIIAKSTQDEIVLLHVVDKQNKVEDAKNKLDSIADSIKKESNVNVSAAVRIGSIFEDIGDAASEIGARLIVMGTHGVKGIQHITGSYALRVITHSVIPFIIVQKKKPEAGYNNIVLPLDLSSETKQKLAISVEIAHYFKSKIHLIVPNEIDKYLVNTLKRNLIYAAKYLKQREISFTTNVGKSTDGNFSKDVTDCAKSVNADLIAIMNLQENSLFGLFGSTYEQQMITNKAQIPVLIVNPSDVTTGGGAGLFS